VSLAVLQPAASGAAQEHFAATIERPVRLESIAENLSVELRSRLSYLYPAGDAPMWGVTPGQHNVNASKYARMSPGDFVFFTGSGRLFAGGTVTAMFRSARLARRL
jgi:hypothetical protein